MRTATLTAIVIGMALGGGPGQAPRAASQEAPGDRPADREAWAARLAALDGADGRAAFAAGQGLAALPGDEGYEILRANWPKVARAEARGQLLRAWYFAEPYPLHLRDHPRLLDALDLGARDRSPEVRRLALDRLGGLAFRDFAEDFPAYEAWYRAHRGLPVREAVARSARRFAAEAGAAAPAEAPALARRLVDYAEVFRDLPEAREAALDAGLAESLGRWAGRARAGAGRDEARLAADALGVLGRLEPGESTLRAVAVPRLAAGTPAEVRCAAIAALAGRRNAWAFDLVMGALKANLEEDGPAARAAAWAAASTLASYDDPRAIPAMIAVIAADGTHDAIYGVGHFGLAPLTGVRYDEAHDGAWWRRWWERNRASYPEAARGLEIPPLAKPRRTAGPDDPGAEAEDLRAGGDEKKRYFLVGARGPDAPADGYGLLVVLPGGDGSAEFLPFVRRIHANALGGRWLVAQAVAPRWDAAQFERVVWPTAGTPYPAARFTTEEFIRAIVADVRGRARVDPRRVVLLGWSSGGPACYAEALRPDSPASGALIAMSVFRPAQLPPPEGARGRAFFLLQSPEDRVTPFRFAEAAERTLGAAGARVRLRPYEGGHGFHGDVWALLRDGIAWLEERPPANPAK